VCGTVRQCGSAAEQAAMCGSSAVQQYRAVYHQSVVGCRGGYAVPPVLAATLCVINQQGAARGGMLFALLYRQSARRGRRGGVVLRT
jgi:hypothetical protein